jgi:hypothetical protein
MGVTGWPGKQEGGAGVSVTIHNLEEFVAAVVDATVGGGVARQAAALREGVQQVLSLTSLRLFNEEELHALVCGQAEAEAWTPDALLVRPLSRQRPSPGTCCLHFAHTWRGRMLRCTAAYSDVGIGNERQLRSKAQALHDARRTH